MTLKDTMVELVKQAEANQENKEIEDVVAAIKMLATRGLKDREFFLRAETKDFLVKEGFTVQFQSAIVGDTRGYYLVSWS